VDDVKEVFLSVKAPPPIPERSSMSGGIIAVIVAVGAFVLLAIILLIVAFRTGKMCFKRPEEKQVRIDCMRE
jgi:hypothetical protein